MKFEEEFPSLINVEGIEHVDGTEYARQGMFYNTKDAILVEDVQKHCLDKQRVKEAQEKVLSKLFPDDWQDRKHLFYELNKELGLEDEK